MILFSKLNDDILYRLFDYLPFEQLVYFERVKSHWKHVIAVVLRGWKSFGMAGDSYYLEPKMPLCACDYGDHRIMHSFNYDLNDDDFTSLFIAITKKCPNIRTLSLPSFIIESNHISYSIFKRFLKL